MKKLIPKKGAISGVIYAALKVIPDERGSIFHCVKRSEICYDISEVYFKKLYAGVVNGWHLHETMTLAYVTVIGVTKLVLVDMREASETYGNLQEFYCGEGNHSRVIIPPGIANASQCVSPNFSLFSNTPDKEHDPSLKYRRIDPFKGVIEYAWFDKNY